MTRLNELQMRLWRKMLDLICEFRQGKLGYYEFVGALEGALDAGEFRDASIVRRWYDAWTPLETVRAQKGSGVSSEEVDPFVSRMEACLKDILVEVEGQQFDR